MCTVDVIVIFFDDLLLSFGRVYSPDFLPCLLTFGGLEDSGRPGDRDIYCLKSCAVLLNTSSPFVVIRHKKGGGYPRVIFWRGSFFSYFASFGFPLSFFCCRSSSYFESFLTPSSFMGFSLPPSGPVNTSGVKGCDRG